MESDTMSFDDFSKAVFNYIWYKCNLVSRNTAAFSARRMPDFVPEVAKTIRVFLGFHGEFEAICEKFFLSIDMEKNSENKTEEFQRKLFTFITVQSREFQTTYKDVFYVVLNVGSLMFLFALLCACKKYVGFYNWAASCWSAYFYSFLVEDFYKQGGFGKLKRYIACIYHLPKDKSPQHRILVEKMEQYTCLYPTLVFIEAGANVDGAGANVAVAGANVAGAGANVAGAGANDAGAGANVDGAGANEQDEMEQQYVEDEDSKDSSDSETEESSDDEDDFERELQQLGYVAGEVPDRCEREEYFLLHKKMIRKRLNTIRRIYNMPLSNYGKYEETDSEDTPPQSRPSSV